MVLGKRAADALINLPRICSVKTFNQASGSSDVAMTSFKSLTRRKKIRNPSQVPDFLTVGARPMDPDLISLVSKAGPSARLKEVGA